MQYNNNEYIRNSYKELFKQLLREKVTDCDQQLEDLCADVAWQSLAYHTSQMMAERTRRLSSQRLEVAKG